MRVLLPVVVLAAVSACQCTPPPAQLEDAGGELTPQCVNDTDCALGEACVEGRCQLPISTGMDGATGCVTDAECPQGERCLRSAGVCVPDTVDAGIEPVDSGVVAECLEGETQTCGTSKIGECKLGVKTCAVQSDGVLRFGDCVGQVDAVTELCNGLDDDCDGQIDDGFATQSCGMGECARTVETCVGGTSITCTAGQPSAEVCDGRDNDCNGTADDGIADLRCGTGACARTVAACVNGTQQTCTPGAPGTETCNGVDDDCNGQTDEGLADLRCGQGICARQVAACSNGQPQTCVPGIPQTEACNGRDDSCDGVIDEGCACNPGATQSCYTGVGGTAGVGVCRSGTQTCSSAGQWGSCVGQVVPSAETCNGLDDDCNAQTDDRLPTLNCGVGACARTAPSCVNGAAGTCTAGTAGTESCNNVDDDCNGTVDDNIAPLSCGQGLCAKTIAACVSGVTQTCMPGPSSTEICNNLDDDCDGQTDESFPQQSQSCPTGVPGLCATGAYQCTSGSLSCQQTVTPVAEICGNNKDENCNGVNDDPMACGCNNTIDRDFDGANECVDCNDLDGTIKPSATEVCNGKDDNCNGTRDEGFDVDGDTFTTCGTVPTGGIDPARKDCNDNNNFVFPLKTTDCGNAATPTTGNGVDDNCNGYADETCNCTTTDRDGDGVTQCAGDCNDTDATISPNRAEVCDGKDNDCNRATVDNCGVSQPCGSKSGNTWTRFATGTDQCKNDLICTSNVSTGELTCGSFCNQTTGTGLNDSCQANEGCYRNLVDSANLHLCSVLTVGTKTAGQACTASTECRSGDCILEGTTRYCSDKCTHEAGCTNTTTCATLKSPIVPGPGPQIQGYYWYSYCKLDTLITATKNTGDACTAGQCRAGPDACFNGKCIEPCCSTSDCASGSACTVSAPKADTGYNTSSGLNVISLMPSCIATTAVRTSGAACSANTDCKSGLCEKTRGVCIDVCCSDATCPNGTTCEPMTLKLSATEQTFIRGCVFAPVPASIELK